MATATVSSVARVVQPATISLALSVREALYLRYLLYMHERSTEDTEMYTPLSQALVDHDSRLHISEMPVLDDKYATSDEYITAVTKHTGLQIPD